MYKVLEHFKDIQDSYHEYNPGDLFPRKGLNVEPARIEELSSNKNRKGRPMIELIKDEKPVKAEIMPEPTKEPKPVKVEEPKEVKKPAEEPVKPKRGRKKKDA